MTCCYLEISPQKSPLFSDTPSLISSRRSRPKAWNRTSLLGEKFQLTMLDYLMVDVEMHPCFFFLLWLTRLTSFLWSWRNLKKKTCPEFMSLLFCLLLWMGFHRILVNQEPPLRGRPKYCGNTGRILGIKLLGMTCYWQPTIVSQFNPI